MTVDVTVAPYLLVRSPMTFSCLYNLQNETVPTTYNQSWFISKFDVPLTVLLPKGPLPDIFPKWWLKLV